MRVFFKTPKALRHKSIWSIHKLLS